MNLETGRITGSISAVFLVIVEIGANSLGIKKNMVGYKTKGKLAGETEFGQKRFKPGFLPEAGPGWFELKIGQPVAVYLIGKFEQVQRFGRFS